MDCNSLLKNSYFVEYNLYSFFCKTIHIYHFYYDTH